MNMRILAVITIILAIAAHYAWAVPAAPITRTITQPDGTTFTARTIGDEWFHWVETTDGHPVVRDESGWWFYADTDLFGDLEASACKAGIDDPAACCIPENVTPRRPDRPTR